MCARHLMKCEGERRGVRVVAWPLLLVLVAVAMCGAAMRSGVCALACVCAARLCECQSVRAVHV